MSALPIAQVIAELQPPEAGASIERIEIESEVRSILLELQAIDPNVVIQIPSDIDEIYQSAARICATRALAARRAN